MTSDLKILSNLMAVINQWEQDGTPPDALLKQVVATVSDIKLLRLYRVAGDHVIQQFSSDDNTSQNVPTQLEEPIQQGDTWLYPLVWRDLRLGILEVEFATAHQPDLAEFIAHQFAVVLDRYAINTMIGNQVFLAARLANCKTFHEIAEALSLDILGDGQFISINLFEYDEFDNFAGFRVIATANRYKSYDADYVIPVRLDEVGTGLRRAVEYGEHFIIDNVQSYDEISEKLKFTLSNDPIVSSCVFPIRSQGKVLGLINFNSVRLPISLTYTETLFWQALADQAGVLVLLHHLTQEAVFSQDISAKQAMVFNQLLAGQTWEDMALIVGRYMMPQSRRLMALAELHYDGDKISGWTIRSVANREKLFDWDQNTELHWQDLGADLQDAVYKNEVFTLKDLRGITPEQIGKRLYDWLERNEVRSYVSVPISSGTHVLGIIILMSRDWNAYLRDEVNAFQNIGELMGALLEVGRLNQETRYAHDMVNNLVIANRMISTAQNAADMAQVVIKTFGKDNISVGLSLLETPIREVTEDKTPHNLAAFSTLDETFLLDEPVPLRKISRENLESLIKGKSVILDIDNDGESLIPPVIFQHLDASNAIKIVLFGLRNGNELMGSLIILSGSDDVLDDDEIGAYTTLADQIGIALKSRQLFAMTQEAQQVAFQLLDANRSITLAEDYSEMAKVILELMPQGILTVSMALFNKPVKKDHLPESIVTRIVAKRDKVLQPNIYDELAPDYPNFDVVISRLLEGGGVSVDDTRNRDNLIKNSTDFLEREGVHSFISVGLRAGRRLLGLLSLGKLPETSVTAEQIANMQAIADQVAVTIENQQLIKDAQNAANSLQRQVRVLQAIIDLTSKLTDTQDEQTLLNSTSQALHDALEVDHVGIAMVMPDGENSKVISEYPDQQTVGFILDVNEKIQEVLENDKAPVIINDVKTDSRLSQVTRKSLIDLGVVSILLLPILDSNGHYIGSIGLDIHRDDFTFEEAEINIARTMTAQIAVILQNIRLLESTQRQARQMEQIVGFSQSIQTTLDVSTLLEISLINTRQIVPADHISIMLYNATRAELRVVASQEGIKDPAIDLNEGAIAKLEGTTAGLVWSTRRSVQIDELNGEDSSIVHTFDPNVQSVLSLPIFARGAMIGVMELGSLKRGRYSATDTVILQQIVSQLAVAIENAEVYAQSQRLAKSKAMVNEISSLLQQQMDIDQILDMTLSELGQVLGAKRARIRLTTDE